MASPALTVIIIGLAVVSDRSVDCKVKVSPNRVRKEWVVGDIEYVRAPQNETPSIVPYVKLAESVAITVCVSATRLTYARISVTEGSKLSDVVSQ